MMLRPQRSGADLLSDQQDEGRRGGRAFIATIRAAGTPSDRRKELLLGGHRYLKLGRDKIALVTGDRVVARVGSSSSDIRDVIQVRLDAARRSRCWKPGRWTPPKAARSGPNGAGGRRIPLGLR